jgi:hypothetical protein
MREPEQRPACASGGRPDPERDVLVQSEGRCSPSFIPNTNKSFRSRLTFGLAIGQAF